jgi:hypothetical protein
MQAHFSPEKMLLGLILHDHVIRNCLKVDLLVDLLDPDNHACLKTMGKSNSSAIDNQSDRLKVHAQV